MRKHFISFAAVLSALIHVAGPLPARAQPASTIATSAEGPRIKFSETLFDFGIVKSLDVLRHDFVVTNTGNAPLEVIHVTPSCGCTIAGVWDRLIQPGKTGRIPIQFSPATFTGQVTKSIMVTCNDPAQPTHTLQIQATISRPIDFQPATVFFAPIVDEDATATKVVRISSNLEQPLILEHPESPHRAFKLEVVTITPGKEFELHVTHAGPVKDGTQSSIAIKTSSTELPVINIGAYVVPQQAISATPSKISLTTDQLRAGVRHVQTIFNRSSEPMQVTAATVNADGVAVEITEPRPGTVFTLTITFPRNLQIRPEQPLALTVRTSNPKHPMITVPIELASAVAPEGAK